MFDKISAALWRRTRVPAAEWLLVFASAFFCALWLRPGPLSLPYFWDEGDVYAPGARWLLQHNFDLRPGHFPDDWSRGHPPLFYLIAALWFAVFGVGPAAAHALMLPFTALALCSTYVLASELGNRWTGVLAFAMLLSSPLFMTMGAFLLPEMPLTALTAFAFVCVVRRWWWPCAVTGILLVWLKETGVGPPVAIFAAVAWRAWRNKTLRQSQRTLWILSLPIWALLAFFLWQRWLAGYFVFPHHQNLLFDRGLDWRSVATILPSTLLWDGRWVLTVAAMLALVLSGRRAESFFADEDATPLLSMVILFFGNAVFFAKMFWLERYALPVHPAVVVLLALCVVAFLHQQRWPSARKHIPIAALVFLSSGFGLQAMWQRGSAAEHSFAFADEVQNHQNAIRAIANRTDNPRIVSTWPLTTEMREPWLGFSAHPLRAVHPDNLAHDAEIDMVLIDSSSRQRPRLEAFAREHGMAMLAQHSYRSAPELQLWGPPVEQRVAY